MLAPSMSKRKSAATQSPELRLVKCRVTWYYCFMKSPDCGEACKNTPAFKAFAKRVTSNEKAARRRYGAGCQPGEIACMSAIENPVFGRLCAAKLTPSVVNEHPEVTWVCPAAKIEDVPGYGLFA